jgi:multiple sugar transport system substrate-binding protein
MTAVAVGSALAVAATLVGCAPGGGGSDPKPTSDGPVTLTMWDYFQPDSASDLAVIELIDEYEEANPNVTVEREFIAYADLKKTLLQSASAAALPDIAIVNSPDHQQFAELGIAVDLTEQLDEWGALDQYPEGLIASAQYEGGIYGLPITANCLAVFYNPAMLEEAGVDVPTTWEEMEEVAAALTGDGRYGLAYSAINNQQSVFQFLPALWQSGADLDDLKSDEAAAALDYWAGLIDAGSVSREALNWDQAAVAAEFGQGRAAMMINGPWQIPFLATEAPDLDYAVALMPVGEEEASVTGGENYMILNGDNQDPAWDFVRWMNEPEQVERLVVASGSLPTRNDISPYEGDELIEVFTEQLQVARPRAYGASYAEIADQLVIALQSRMTGTATSKDALATAADSIAPLLP